MATMTGPCALYDPRPNAPFFTIGCICCRGEISIHKRYDSTEEKMRYITPRIHTCRCGARILLYRFNERTQYSEENGRLLNHGEVVYRHCGAYESVDELKYTNERDSWKFYLLYNVLPLSEKVAIMTTFPGKTP